jgi:hypothetical protein
MQGVDVMNKMLMVVGIFTVSFVTLADETVNSPQIAVGLGVDQGLSAILELNRDYRLSVGNDGMAFDYQFVRGQINQVDVPLDWYVGVGAWSEWGGDEYGARLPLGIDWVYQKQFRLYGQIQPELDLEDDADLQLGASVGVTYQF